MLPIRSAGTATAAATPVPESHEIGFAASALGERTLMVMLRLAEDSTTGSAMPLLKARRIRALAVTSAKPSALLPGVPTMAASGLPGFDVEVLYAILAPADTPPAIVAALNKAIVQAINQPGTKEKFAGAGLEAVGSTPEQLAGAIKNEMTTLGAVIRNAGIKLD